ncbi:MAG TPA: PQQ-binding-like beta-propeller repeat protein, partial [Pirellulales bacterium]|nr:PQQ-binding-like beta-propeller repeat protein [Pirellulales bacterium]
ENILHAQWASPSNAVLGGRPQVIFAGGDGWLYSFDPAGDGAGQSKLLWKFDCNPKDSKYSVGGRSTRNQQIGFICVYDGLLYFAPGEDPEHGEGNGRLWCIDPAKHLDGSDVSAELVVDRGRTIVPHRRICAVDPAQGERVTPNPNSAVVWQYAYFDHNFDGKPDFEEQFHRTLGTPVIQDDLLYIADFSGLFHCLDAKTGEEYWYRDLFAASWGSALLVDGKVYVGDEEGKVSIFRHSADPVMAMPDGAPLAEIEMGNSIYSTPIVANDVLYVVTKDTLYAIESREEVPGGAP